MIGTTSNWEDELRGWLKPFLDRLGHKSRRRMCLLYVAGLIGPGDRKSVQPMAERLAPGDCDQLHHFVAAGVWDAAPLETELLIQADRLVGGSDAVLVIDDTAVPKKGTHSVGVAAQYASALGKTANCQALVSLTLARGEVPVMVALRLFLPDSWVNNRRRLKRAGVPAEYRTSRTKPEIALAEIDRLISIGVRFRCVLADAGYGLSAPFRQGLTARKLAWAVGIPRHLKVYPVGVQLIWPVTKVRGRPRKRHVPDSLSTAAEDMLASAQWRTVRWRSGTKGRLKARFAAVRVRTADGPPQRIWDKGQQHLPGDEAWLIGEHRASGEKKRPDDTVGFAAIANAITPVHAEFLNKGGLGILIGDGQLPHPGLEQIVETYYQFPIYAWKVMFDYQFVVNPAYNRDRGPVSIGAIRLHSEF